MKISAEEEGMFGGRLISRGVFAGAKAALCALLLCGLVLPAAARTKSFNTSSAKFSSLPAGAQSAISASLGRDQQAYHAAAVGKGYQMKNPRSGLQATFTRQGVRVESGKASWGMSLAAFGTVGQLQPVAGTKPEANENRVEYRRGALTEWYVNGPAGLEQGFKIARAPAGNANGTIELALRLTGNMAASVDAAKKGLILKGRQTSLRYSGLAARDAKGRKLPSWLEVRNGRLRVRVDAAGATYPLVVDPWIQVTELVASDGTVGDELGFSVAVSGDGSTVVALNVWGDAYVFTAASNWGQAAKLVPSQRGVFFIEPQQVAVSGHGKVVVVGSPFAGEDTGAAFVFVEPVNGWSSEANPDSVPETALLYASDYVNEQLLGYSVAVSADGKTVVAGAPVGPYVSFNSNGSGAAYVFEEPDGGWGADPYQQQAETAKLVASDPHDDDFLGFSVSISNDGSTVAVGASEILVALISGQNPNLSPGAAYVFVRPGSAWTGTANNPQPETAKLVHPDGSIYDFLGTSVAVSGDGSTVVAGAPFDPGTINPTTGNIDAGPGAAYVFDEPGAGWGGGAASAQPETAELVASDGNNGDGLGLSVAVSEDGSKVAAGSPLALNESNLQAGAVYTFTKPTTANGWADAINPQTETDKALASDGAGGDHLGYSTSMSSDGLKLAAGAPTASVNSMSVQGAAYVFTGNEPFSSFNAGKLRITQDPFSFTFSSSFVLGANSDGISPLTEPVTLKIGSLSLTIPAGSFQTQHKTGYYVFSGVVDGFTINAKFEETDFYNWTFKANGSSPNALSITDPVTVTLTIGNDSGTVTETVPITIN